MTESPFREFALKQQERWKSERNWDQWAMLMPSRAVQHYWNLLLDYLPPYIPPDLSAQLKEDHPEPLVQLQPKINDEEPHDLSDIEIRLRVDENVTEPEQIRLLIEGQRAAGEYVNDILVMDVTAEIATRHPDSRLRDYFNQVHQLRSEKYNQVRVGFSRFFKTYRRAEIDELQRALLLYSLTGEDADVPNPSALFISIGRAGPYPWNEHVKPESLGEQVEVQEKVSTIRTTLGANSLEVPGLITMALTPFITKPFQQPMVRFTGTLLHEMGHYLSHRQCEYGLMDIEYSDQAT